MSAAKICPQCNAEYPLDQRFCPLDGAALRSPGASTDLVGSIVAERYHVLRKLGEGGMGQVYLAEHVRMGRKSALKVLHPSMMKDADAISRFNREAANASRISHPNVAAIYDFGETDEGLIYLAMEYVEGEPLTALTARSGPLPPARVGDIIRQAADALGVAHDMGIVHRDLKPDNIMLTRSHDGSDCVKVVDFGIAKAEGGGTAQKVTKTGLVIGTPEYMSPEQLAGDRLDGRSDIYSLALVAYHLLTGQVPFPSESVQESMIMRLLEKPRRLADARPDVAWPAELQAVLDRALERDAKLRYAKAAEFGREFVRAVAGVPGPDPATSDAATVVIGAAGTRIAGAAPARTLVPPTIADRPGGAVAGEGRDAAGTPAVPPIAPGNRTPVLVAAAVLVMLGIGAGALKFMGGDGAALPAANGQSAPVTAADSAQVIADAAAASKTAVIPDQAPPPSSVAPSPQETRGRAQAAVANQLERADRLAESEATAGRALRTLGGLRGRIVPGSEHDIWSRLIEAEANVMLGRDAQACRIVGTIKGKSEVTHRNDRISMLRQSCQ